MTHPVPRLTAAFLRRAVSCGFVALGILSAGSLVGCAEPGPTRPNLLLITIDTLRADWLGCYGGDPELGAGICSLADGGTLFRWAFAAAPYTAPSLASLLTSLYPAHHGVTENSLSFLSGDVVTVAELLEAEGYSTAAFVSNPVLERGRNLGQGFDVYDARMTREERNRPGFAERDARATTDAVLAWARVGADPPWFLWVHFQDPHGPYEPPGAARMLDEPGAARLPLLDDHSGRGGIPKYQALPGLFSPGAYERRYRAEIEYLDPQLTRLVDGLDALGDPPAVLLTADHGEAFGEDGYFFAHGHSVGLDQIRVPLLWRPARPAAGGVEDAPVSLLDVAPTLLRAAGTAVPEVFQGRPLPAAGLGVSPEGESRPIFADHRNRVAVVAGRVYYARDKPGLDAETPDRVSGGRLSPLPARTARLDAEGPLPAYTAAAEGGTGATLEPLVSEFLESGRGRTSPRRFDLSPQTRERLRALGYLD